MESNADRCNYTFHRHSFASENLAQSTIHWRFLSLQQPRQLRLICGNPTLGEIMP